jgi:hypothetical protein
MRRQVEPISSIGGVLITPALNSADGPLMRLVGIKEVAGPRVPKKYREW